MDEAKPQFTIRSILTATSAIAIWLTLFRFAPVMAAFLGLTLPLILALRRRKQILATPVLNRLPIRLPLFLVLFSMFYIGALGPSAAVVSLTGADHDNGTLAVAVVAVLFAPAWVISIAMPPLAPLVESYMRAWMW